MLVSEGTLNRAASDLLPIISGPVDSSGLWMGRERTN